MGAPKKKAYVEQEDFDTVKTLADAGIPVKTIADDVLSIIDAKEANTKVNRWKFGG